MPKRVIEFYAGIGGMHLAWQLSGIPHQVIAAYEINTSAVEVYKANFDSKIIKNKNLDHITAKELDHYQAEVWCMSPPCQPYTVMGLKEGSKDNRSKSFLNLLKQLEIMKKQPECIIIENVKGFEVSDTHRLMFESLKKCGYGMTEYLLSPLQFGIPNSRLRYYLIAKKGSDTDISEPQTFIEDLNLTAFPKRKVSDYLIYDQSNLPLEFYLSNQLLWKYGGIIDFIKRDSEISCCFTKNYFRYLEGTGSFIQEENIDFKDVFDLYFKMKKEDEDYLSKECPLLALKLRFFTPREIANLLYFPADFKLPVSLKSQYKLLGNSINIFVVSLLIKKHFS